MQIETNTRRRDGVSILIGLTSEALSLIAGIALEKKKTPPMTWGRCTSIWRYPSTSYFLGLCLSL